MDGVTALKFARSRHALGDEGTDFARSKRQEKVIVAFKEKLLSSKTLLSPSTLQTLVKSVTDSLDTDVSDVELGGFIHLFLSYAKSNESPKSVGIEDLYINPKNTAPYAGAWVLIPKTKQEDIYAYVANALNN
jgi:anionic cell wall polymer biosynthesis LytR-Cps2A-Psr (LCP) family protein